MKIFITILLFSLTSASAEPGPALSELLKLSGSDLTEIKIEIPSAIDEKKEAVSEDWRTLVQKIYDKGTFNEGDVEIPASKSFAELSAPEGKPRKADYVNIWGYVNDEGKFIPSFATMVSENWEIKNGNWHIFQWLHALDIDGTPTESAKRYIVENMDGRILDMKTEKISAVSDAAKTNRAFLIKKWLEFVPKATK